MLWIPIVEQWTHENAKRVWDATVYDAPWYMEQQFSLASGIEYVNEQWQFKNKPTW